MKSLNKIQRHILHKIPNLELPVPSISLPIRTYLAFACACLITTTPSAYGTCLQSGNISVHRIKDLVVDAGGIAKHRLWGGCRTVDSDG